MFKWFQIKQKINVGNVIHAYIHTDTNIHTKLRGKNFPSTFLNLGFMLHKIIANVFFMLFKFSWLKVVCVFDWLQKSNFYKLSQPWKFTTKHQVISFFFIFLRINFKKVFANVLLCLQKIFSSF